MNKNFEMKKLSSDSVNRSNVITSALLRERGKQQSENLRRKTDFKGDTDAVALKGHKLKNVESH